MKRLLLVLNTLLPLLLLSNLLPAKSETVLEQLKRVNTNWNTIPVFTDELLQTRQIGSETELIQTHLQFAIRYLEANSKFITDKTTSLKRQDCITTLKRYCSNGVFPINNHHLCRQPYFIDDFGNYCAVGYLLKTTGYDKVAQQIHKEMNYAYVKEIPANYLSTWAKEYGFSIDELALIQPNYPTQVFCKNDTFFIGKNTSTVCPILKNDIIKPYLCAATSYQLIVTILDSATHGTTSLVTLPTDTFIVYTPDTNFTGSDSLRYKITYIGWGCEYSPDSVVAVFNVLNTPGNYISLTPGDVNYDGEIDNKDFVLLAKSMGEHGPGRPANGPVCNATYSYPWNSSFMNYNTASSDADGNGMVNETDYDLAQNCFITNNIYEITYDPVPGYILVFEPFDNIITAGDSLNLKFHVEQFGGNGNNIPIKSIAMRVLNNFTARLDFYSFGFDLQPVVDDTNLTTVKNYTHRVIDFFQRKYLYAGCLALSGHPSQNQTSVVSDTFTITGRPVIEDSIHSNGYVTLALSQITALDANDNLIPIRAYSLGFSTTKATTGINNINFTSFSIYPNPASSSITVSVPEELLNGVLLVYDITGREVLKSEIENSKSEMNTTGLANGVYFITIRKNGLVATQKLVVQR